MGSSVIYMHTDAILRIADVCKDIWGYLQFDYVIEGSALRVITASETAEAFILHVYIRLGIWPLAWLIKQPSEFQM